MYFINVMYKRDNDDDTQLTAPNLMTSAAPEFTAANAAATKAYCCEVCLEVSHGRSNPGCWIAGSSTGKEFSAGVTY